VRPSDQASTTIEAAPGMERPMKTNFTRRDLSRDDEGGGFFNWAIIVVAAGLLFAATAEFTAAPAVANNAAPAKTTIVQTVTPHKT
jgi:hypothetical protein